MIKTSYDIFDNILYNTVSLNCSEIFVFININTCIRKIHIFSIIVFIWLKQMLEYDQSFT